MFEAGLGAPWMRYIHSFNLLSYRVIFTVTVFWYELLSTAMTSCYGLLKAKEVVDELHGKKGGILNAQSSVHLPSDWQQATSYDLPMSNCFVWCCPQNCFVVVRLLLCCCSLIALLLFSNCFVVVLLSIAIFFQLISSCPRNCFGIVFNWLPNWFVVVLLKWSAVVRSL